MLAYAYVHAKWVYVDLLHMVFKYTYIFVCTKLHEYCTYKLRVCRHTLFTYA